ncbi:MAG: hypothetical protein QF614_02145, partial [SAR324 cluster bacterium]|nr:hypothetical protein [SAR324 cluster bacterium]
MLVDAFDPSPTYIAVTNAAYVVVLTRLPLQINQPFGADAIANGAIIPVGDAPVTALPNATLSRTPVSVSR